MTNSYFIAEVNYGVWLFNWFGVPIFYLWNEDKYEHFHILKPRLVIYEVGDFEISIYEV